MMNELPTVVNEDKNEELNKKPELQEVKEAIIGLNKNSTKVPDAMNGAFFQDAWDIIIKNVHNMVIPLFYGLRCHNS